MRLRGESTRKRKGLRSVEVLQPEETAEKKYFDYERDLTPEAKTRIEEIATFFAEDFASIKLPSDTTEALGAVLFLDSIGKPFPLDTQKVMNYAQEWRKHQESLYSWDNIKSRLSPETLISIAAFVSLNPDSRAVFDSVIESQRTHLSAQALSGLKPFEIRAYMLPAMVLFPEQKAELLSLQGSWAPNEASVLKKSLASGHYIQEAEFWRLIGDLVTAPDHLPEWRDALGEWWENNKESMNTGLGTGPQTEDPATIFLGEMNVVYEVLVGQLLTGAKVDVDPLGKLSVHPPKSALEKSVDLPERLVA